MAQVQCEGLQVPANTLRRRVTVGECRRKVAFSGIYALMTILAVIFAPHAYMKFGFAFSGLIRLATFRREYDLLTRIKNGEIVETISQTRPDKHSTTASIVAVALVTIFALCCTALSIATLLFVSSNLNVVAFFVVANLIVWGFAACIWRAAYRSARLPTIAPQARLSKSEILKAVSKLNGIENPAVEDIVALVPTSTNSKHWWTDTQIREEVKVTVQR